ncbi:MAG: type II secretion system F family protein [Flavobacterium sp.]|uniref:type II secretion system F family protein n=1 Tax=Flavobacterium sp. TaxID=239 RepID=UPI0026340759|nr:type II secretion system F family protein [Flavobacterium sp.]MDD5149129.1 type II secretion system F family protein [Flavobacterium sp.]
MSIEILEKNINHEEQLAEELYKISRGKNKNPYINSLKNQIKIINDSIPALLDEIEIIKKLAPEEKKSNLVQMDYSRRMIDGEKRISVSIPEKDKPKFIKSIEISEAAVKKMEKPEGRKTNYFTKLSSKLFFDISNSFVEKGYFVKLNSDLRKANIKLLLNTYLSIMLLSTLISFFAGWIIFIFLLFFDISGTLPFITISSGEIGMRFVKNFWVVIALPLFTFFIFYLYPSSEAKTIGKKIEQELPFVVINMSAIASSNIEPSKIFQIISKSGDEYPCTKGEIDKVMNYINIYGYDLTTALRAAAEKTSSKNLKELFEGLANSVTSGTSLTNFLDKRAESLLFNYRLERERYTKLAETFMNIYISLVIAAPLVLMLTFFLMSLGGLGLSISLNMITLLIVLIVILINIFFLVFLHFKQPTY